jgi:hypothetical protein
MKIDLQKKKELQTIDENNWYFYFKNLIIYIKFKIYLKLIFKYINEKLIYKLNR